jgi:uncharacterized protein YyaL (SSP411 family)
LATPLAIGAMAECQARLFLLTGNEEYRERAEKLIRSFSSSQARNLVSQSGLMIGFQILVRTLSIVIVGDDEKLVRTAIEAAPPWRVILRIAPGLALAGNLPAYGKTAIDKLAAFVCTAGTCSLPMDSAESLRDHLAKL